MTEKYSMAQDEFMDLLDKAEPLNKPHEILPPSLLEDCGERLCGEQVLFATHDEDMAFKQGMEFCYIHVQPLMQAALPHYEAGLRDTRLGQADAGKLAELARYKEMATYES